MKNLTLFRFSAISLFFFFIFQLGCQTEQGKIISLVNPMNGTAGNGAISPVAVMPFGMVQLGPDTKQTESGYHYDDSTIIGFSHLHKSGGGCSDFMDIMLQPFVGENQFDCGSEENPSSGYRSSFSHEQEKASVGLYKVKLLDYGIDVELTSTKRCGMHRYYYPEDSIKKVILDLKHGSNVNCTIIAEDNYDTVKVSTLRIIDVNKLEGCRISVGWAKDMQVYFAMEFSIPFVSHQVYNKGVVNNTNVNFKSNDIKGIFEFKPSEEPLLVRVGISNVSVEGAWQNLKSEMNDWDFDRVVSENQTAWERQFDKFKIKGGTPDEQTIFYTALYHVFTYPMLFSDTDGKFRGPDHKVHVAEGYNNYSGVVGVWDTYRSAIPLITIANPQVTSDYVNTLLDHYDIYGLLPVWTLWGNETFCMLGYHSLPVIADAFSKGIRGFDSQRALNAMVATAEKDTFGYWMRRWIGLKNYKKYGFVPADLELTSVSKTLEYAYDDWCLSQMAKLLGDSIVYKKYKERSKAYRYIYDSNTGFMRGKLTDGTWSVPFNPYATNHWRDDYAEGTAWQWTFFVPHDVNGLASLMGGKEKFISKLDSLFLANSKLDGDYPSPDIGGFIGQYAHANEPGHHTIFMYNLVGQAWKCQQKARQIMKSFYQNKPLAYCGNDDTGQMASWYVWNAIGLFPYTHGDGTYMISSPVFDEAEVTMGDTSEAPVLKVTVENNSEKNIYIKEFYVNDYPYKKTTITHEELKNAKLKFVMASSPGHWFTD